MLLGLVWTITLIECSISMDLVWPIITSCYCIALGIYFLTMIYYNIPLKNDYFHGGRGGSDDMKSSVIYQWLCMWEVCVTHIQLLRMKRIRSWEFWTRSSCDYIQCRGLDINPSLSLFHCNLILNYIGSGPPHETIWGYFWHHISVIFLSS